MTNAEILTPNASSDSDSSPELRRAPTVQFPKTRVILRTRFRRMHEMATVVVGPAQVKFVLHTDLLISTSPFFAAALQGHFAESNSQTVTLPEEKPDIFEWFVQWLYTGSLMVAGPTNCTPPEAEPVIGARRPQDPVKRFQIQESHSDGDLRNSQGSPKYFLLVDLYALSDRLLTTSLSNHIIDTVARLSETTNSVPTPSDTWLLYGDCCSYSGLHHCACTTRRASNIQLPGATEVEMEIDPSPPTKSLKTPHPCPHPPTGPNTGVRPSSPLRDLILDLFTYKKTDRLLQTHKDDWHPLFLRDLVVKMKRPGRDMLARHKLREWRPRTWHEAKACEGCRGVVGPGSGFSAPAGLGIGVGVNGAARGAAQVQAQGRGAHAHALHAAQLVNHIDRVLPHVPRGSPDHQRLTRMRARNVGMVPPPANNENAIEDGDEDAESQSGAATAEVQQPRFLGPQKCATCERVYCLECMVSAVEGRGLENGDGKFALLGGDVGPCKPWLNWEDLFGEREGEGEDGEGMGGGRMERGAYGGVCGRYHEHGMLGGRVEG